MERLLLMDVLKNSVQVAMLKDELEKKRVSFN
jgi:hypothetical protein